MTSLLEQFDDLAAVGNAGAAARWFERLSFFFILLLAIAAPHSFQLSQIAYLAAAVFVILRLTVGPSSAFRFTWLDACLLGFFLWTVITALVSYAPEVSIPRLRLVGIFSVFYIASAAIRSFRAVYFLVCVLLLSSAVNVFWTPVERIFGRGVEIEAMRMDGLLAKSGFEPGDVLLAVDGKKINSPQDLSRAVNENETVTVKYQNLEFYYDEVLTRANLTQNDLTDPDLGITKWKRSRNWRAAGFYGHYASYADSLLLIGSLLLGIFVAVFFWNGGSGSSRKFTSLPVYIVGIAGFAVSLVLTATRAHQFAALVSGFVIVLLGAARKWLVTFILIAIPVAIVGGLVLQNTRKVNYLDTEDTGNRWRQTIYREGLELWTKSPRNFIFGVGMDSVNVRSKEWGLYGEGTLPRGNFHSMALQVAVERGLPGLLLWMSIMLCYIGTLFRAVRSETGARVEKRTGNIIPDYSSVLNRGIWLGCIGGSIGVCISGLVHYNFAEREVIVLFYFLMALSVKLITLRATATPV